MKEVRSCLNGEDRRKRAGNPRKAKVEKQRDRSRIN
jgi:hypothetical protein